MKYIKAELHNHSTHSDGSYNIEDLLRFAAENNFGFLALTDHNTVSGHKPAHDVIKKENIDISLIEGIEITTFWGHILALGINNMVDITKLNPNNPELFFAYLKNNGCKAIGIAHPYCAGRPITEGCKFTMNITNFNAIDYIEIANTSSVNDSIIGNSKALKWWESLVLSGNRLGAVSGKDLHNTPKTEDVFLTYAILSDNCTPTVDAIISAILSQKTVVTKGPLLYTATEDNKINIIFDEENEYPQECILSITDSEGNENYINTNLKDTVTIECSKNAKAAVVKLYSKNKPCNFENLVAVAPPIYFK